MQSSPVNEKEAQAEFVPEKITFFTPWKKYRIWKGRSCRKEFWYFFLTILFMYIIVSCALNNTIIVDTISILLTLLLSIYPACSLCIRRLHDIGLSGFWFLYWMVVLIIQVTFISIFIGGVVLYFLLLCGILGCVNSHGGINKYGNNPKGEGENKQNLIQKLQMRSVLLKYAVVVAFFLLSLLPLTVVSGIFWLAKDVKISLSEQQRLELMKYSSPELLFMQAFSQDNPENAVKLFRYAAEGRYIPAQIHLGLCYAEGRGVAQDFSEAVKWYRQAANQGSAFAQSLLGKAYFEGRGVAQDYSEAVKWFRKAGEQGFAEAQYLLGCAYFEGRGVARDYNEAVKWFCKASDQGVAEAQCIIFLMGVVEKGIAQDLTEAVMWCRQAANQGNAFAQNTLGLCYETGWCGAQDLTEAVKWYRQAANQGDEFAQYSLGRVYESGKGVTQDLNEAVKWYRQAANQGNAVAQYSLGRVYEREKGVAKDEYYDGFVKWYRKAADQGHEAAAIALKELEGK